MNALFPGLHWVVPEKLRDHTSWPKVDFATFDISAHRDVKYEGAKGTIRFEKGRKGWGENSIDFCWLCCFFFFNLFICLYIYICQVKCSNFSTSSWLEMIPSKQPLSLVWSWARNPIARFGMGEVCLSLYSYLQIFRYVDLDIRSMYIYIFRCIDVKIHRCIGLYIYICIDIYIYRHRDI